MEYLLTGIGLAAIICSIYTLIENHLILRDTIKREMKHIDDMNELYEIGNELDAILRENKASTGTREVI